jgi:hypothetical protein
MSQTNQTAQEGTMTTVATRDGKTVNSDQAQALNIKRLNFVLRLLAERLNLGREYDLVQLVKNCADKARFTTLVLMKNIQVLAKSLEARGPAAYAYADTGCDEAAKIAAMLEKPDYTTPPASWGKDYKVPALFIPLPVAMKAYEDRQAKEAEKAAKKAAEQAARAKKEQEEREAAEAERARQLAETGSAADFLLGLADSDVAATVEQKSAERQAAKAEQQKERQEREAATKRFIADGLSERLTALGHRSPKGAWYVSDKEQDALSMRRLADLANTPDAEIRSYLTGSTYAGRLSDTWTREGSDQRMSCWMGISFRFALVTENGGRVKDKGVQMTANATVPLHSHEITLVRQVATELGLVKQDDPESWKAFKKTFHLQALRFVDANGVVRGAAAWAASVLTGGKGRQTNGDDDRPGHTVHEGPDPDDLDRQNAQAPKADGDPDRKPEPDKPVDKSRKGRGGRKSGTHGKNEDSGPALAPVTTPKPLPGDHTPDETSPAYVDSGDDGSNKPIGAGGMLAALQRTLNKAKGENPTGK